MEELLKNAKEELKRVDHLIYVSLKYTRTVDVIRNVLQRLISSFDFVAAALLKKALDEEKIEVIPQAPKLKCEELEKLYKDDKKILKAITEYLLLRQIMRLEYDKINEYRRHVGMIVKVDDKEMIMNIDEVTEFYKKAKDLIEYIEKTYND